MAFFVVSAQGEDLNPHDKPLIIIRILDRSTMYLTGIFTGIRMKLPKYVRTIGNSDRLSYQRDYPTKLRIYFPKEDILLPIGSEAQ
jgi:hypothetical protein